MSRNRPDVVYVHHGAPRIYEIVHAIVRSGHSCRLLSGYYFRENGLPERILRQLPQRWTIKLLANLKRRHIDSLRPELVERSWVQEILMGIERSCSSFLPNFMIARNRYIDIRAAVRVLMLRPKIVISCDSHALFTLRAAKRIGAVAVLDQVIGHVDAGNKILSMEKELHPEAGSAFRPTPARMVRRCIREVREADFILASSDYVRDSILPFGVSPDRIIPMPFGVDLSLFAPAADTPVPPFKILFAGHIGLRKGVWYLLEAVRQADIPDLQVVLLGNIEGDGQWLRKYEDLYVHIRHTPRQEIPAIFADAHIYVFPSLHEGSTVSIYEAMASGLPVVTTPNAGSVVRDGKDGFIVPVRDIDAIRDRIERLYRDPGLRAGMGRNGVARAAEYSWDAYSRRIGAALNDILRNDNTGKPGK
jgi:alpha-maltose-1-phosphate synthase